MSNWAFTSHALDRLREYYPHIAEPEAWFGKHIPHAKNSQCKSKRGDPIYLLDTEVRAVVKASKYHRIIITVLRPKSDDSLPEFDDDDELCDVASAQKQAKKERRPPVPYEEVRHNNTVFKRRIAKLHKLLIAEHKKRASVEVVLRLLLNSVPISISGADSPITLAIRISPEMLDKMIGLMGDLPTDIGKRLLRMKGGSDA